MHQKPFAAAGTVRICRIEEPRPSFRRVRHDCDWRTKDGWRLQRDMSGT
jgi:hypothetical protein